MDADRIEELRNKVSFISGSSKNAGKTTYLNYLLTNIRGQIEFAFLTIGIDGEGKDQIFGNDKPVIETEEGDVLLSCESMMTNSDASFTILEVFPWKTVLGKLLLLKTIRKGLIELAGPENNHQLEIILGNIRNTHQIESIIIDGAINRITQISSALNSQFFYIMKINRESLKSLLEKMKIISLLNDVGTWSKAKSMENVKYISGAITKNSFQDIPKEVKTIIIDDFTKIFLNLSELRKLLEIFSIYFKNKIKLISFVCNLYDIEEQYFIEQLKSYNIKNLITFNPYKVREERK